MIVRDLWAYQIAMSPPVSPPWLDPSGTGDQADSRTPVLQDGVGENTDQDMAGGGNDSSSDDESESGFSLSRRTEPEVDPELLAMLSEGDGSDKEEGEMREVSPGREVNHWRRRRRLKISDTIATLSLGLWMLRWPVSFIQIERWVLLFFVWIALSDGPGSSMTIRYHILTMATQHSFPKAWLST